MIHIGKKLSLRLKYITKSKCFLFFCIYAVRFLLKPVIVRRATSLPVVYINNLRPVNFVFTVMRLFRAHFSSMPFAPFCSTVLEPNFNLALRHSEGICQSCPFRPGEVFRLFEGFFKCKYLVATERWSSVFPFAVCFSFTADWETLSRCWKHAEIGRTNGHRLVNSGLAVLSVVV